MQKGNYLKTTINPEKLTSVDLKEWLEDVHEKYYIELKKAQELPNSFWESYSSFSNTSGGWIILGVEEGTPKNKITGVGNSEKTLTSLWDQVSNSNKVSFRNIENQDVNTYIIDGKTVIIIYVKEAADNMKPVYIGGKFENTWIRTGDGDRKVTKEELTAFMRNSQPGYDSLYADNFSMDDLDKDSVIAYKERVNKRFPKKHYIEMDNNKMFYEILEKIFDNYLEKKLSFKDYNIKKDEFKKFIYNARKYVGELFNNDPIKLNDELCMKILNDSYL